MATRYWVGGSGTWDASATTHWAASSGGASGASAPTSSDDVVIDTSSTGGTITIASGAAANNVTVTWTAAKTNVLTLSANFAPAGTFSVTGNSDVNRILIQSSVAGTARTITAAAVSLTNVDFIDITGAGAATWSGTLLGDALGNSGITFATPATQYWKTTTTGTKTWSTAANWFLATNGAGGAGRVPLPQDDVVFDASSIGAASTTISMDMPRSGKSITFAGVTNTPTLSIGSTSIYGSLTLSSGMAALSNAGTLSIAARSSVTLTSAGKTFLGAINASAPGITLTLLDALTVDPASGFTFGGVGSTLVDGGFSVSTGTFVTGSAGTLNLTGAWTLTGSGNAWNMSATMTITSMPSVIKLTNATSSTKTFIGAGKTYNNIWLSGAGSGAYTFTGSNTFNDFRVDTLPKNIQFTAGTTTTIASWTGPAYSAAATKFAQLPAVSGSYFSTPDSAAASVTGDIDLRAYIQGNLRPTAIAGLVSKQASAAARSYRLTLDTNGTLVLYWSEDGSTSLSKTSTAAVANVTTALWVRATLDVDNGASGNTVTFYTSTDGTSWTPLGSAVVTAGVTSIYDGTQAVEVGASFIGTQQLWDGYVYRAQVYNGIAGSLVVDFNPNTWNSGNTWTSATGEVWTRNGNALLSPEVKISSVTSATHTLTKTGGGTVDVGRRGNITYSIGSPASTFYAGANGTDGGNNTNWTFNNAPAVASYSNTEGSEAVASGGANACVGTLVKTEGSETLASVGANSVHGILVITDASDSLSAGGTLSINAAFVDTDSEALVAAGTVAIAATAVGGDGDETLATTGYAWFRSASRTRVIDVDTTRTAA